jgi:hypothetical protein
MNSAWNSLQMINVKVLSDRNGDVCEKTYLLFSALNDLPENLLKY